MTLLRELVVGMHLYAQVLARVDELDEQGELVAEALIDLVAHEQPLVLVDELRECESHIDIVDKAAFDGHAVLTGHATDLPALADVGLRGINALEWGNLISSPDGGFQDGFKLVWFHCSSN